MAGRARNVVWTRRFSPPSSRRLPLVQHGKEAQCVGVVRVHEQPLFHAQCFKLGRVLLLGHVIDRFAALAVDGVAIPIHDERLATLAVVPSLPVEHFPVKQLLLQRADHRAVGVPALQDARGFPAEFRRDCNPSFSARRGSRK